MARFHDTAGPASLQAGLTYSARRNVLEPVLTWRLADDALACECEGRPFIASKRPLAISILLGLVSWLLIASSKAWPASVPYRDITMIRLRFDPTRFDGNRYRCDLRNGAGARTTIFSTSYAGPGSFEDRAAHYAPFIRVLVQRVQVARPSVKIASGISWPAYVLQHGLLLAALLALVTVLGVAGLPGFGSNWVKLAIIASYGGALWRYARRNWPRDLSLPPRG
jgi:hypothetical protein